LDKLLNPHNTTSFGTSTSGLARHFGNIGATGWDNSTTATSSEAASVVMSSTFTNNNGVGNTAINVNESGLFNMTDGDINNDAMFARQVFSTITLNPGDSLTVQWTINVGGTGTITGG
jgi:hypothetical protein